MVFKKRFEYFEYFETICDLKLLIIWILKKKRRNEKCENKNLNITIQYYSLEVTDMPGVQNNLDEFKKKQNS